ncbi:hypothetical protein M404DRAFT_999076 [Pisolithus tinctorius Marx 270]|uniref:Uncharacterized protein n=1 Tax=Pisolithus tinctorius Marx 270 TaxID=870435 RepID=A0A0C3NZY8_PISTI|nr:hypothetical protein M404DRAFT_999076 [Pisolithus tinctorius Marx 270]
MGIRSEYSPECAFFPDHLAGSYHSWLGSVFCTRENHETATLFVVEHLTRTTKKLYIISIMQAFRPATTPTLSLTSARTRIVFTP